MKKATKPILQLIIVARQAGLYCASCGRTLKQCGLCKGGGLFQGYGCEPCNGQGRLCPVIEGDLE